MLKTLLHCADGRELMRWPERYPSTQCGGCMRDLGESAAAALASRRTGEQAALINLTSGLATALGFSELHRVRAQVIFFLRLLFFPQFIFSVLPC